MTAGCGQIIGLVMLVVTNLAIVIGFATPYWTETYVFTFGHTRGLWADCSQQDCRWVFDDDYRLQRSRPEWYMATQGLMSLGLGLGLIALLIATLSLCCTCHKCNPHPPICGLLACAGLAMGVACIVFGVKANQTWNIKLEWDTLTSGRFGWSYWVAVSASVLSLLTSGIYGCIGRSSDR